MTSPEDSTTIEQLSEKFYAGLLTLDQVCQVLRVSKYALGKMVREGELTTVRVGITTYIGEGTLRSYIAGIHAAANGAPAPRDELAPEGTPTP